MTTAVPLATYRNRSPYPFCPGCGHSGILDALDRALVALSLDPRLTVIVSDIGCAGLSNQYFETSTFQGLHGRSITYATGIKVARPDLNVIVVMGDGGCGIGGAHLLSAARRNVGLTVVVFNNLTCGMTGGQHSVTTPEGSITATTAGGHLERPFDICGTVAVNGAGYVYRGTVFDKDLPKRLAEAIAHDGFALLDVWETCTAHSVPHGNSSRKALSAVLEELKLPTGVLQKEQRPEYARALRGIARRPKRADGRRLMATRFRSPLRSRVCMVVAGSAGSEVRAAARLGAIAAVLSGLHAAQRDDDPVTVKTGHSVSELVLGPEPIEYSGVAKPEAVVIASAEGLEAMGHHLKTMGPGDSVFAPPELAPVESAARKVILDARARGVAVPRSSGPLVYLTAALTGLGIVSEQALAEAARQNGRVQEDLHAISAGALLGKP